MHSSYIENDYGLVLKSYVLNWRPSTAVELGILDGYSTRAIAEGIKELNFLLDMSVRLTAYDLFDDYQFKHGSQEEVEKMLKDQSLDHLVRIKKGDAFKVHADFADDSVEFLHVDISNTGDTLRKIMELWTPKIAPRGLILFEGGSIERDNIEWMKKYSMPSIKQEIDTSKFIHDNYFYGTYYAFPSMTVFLRKW